MGLGAALSVGSAAALPAATGAASAPGYCRTSQGVTVVVDFTDLGGSVVVRCVPSANGGTTGLAALQAAGFSTTGTQRWGDGIVCRVQGRPSASETLAIKGNPHYHEKCVDTPPTQAYWTYWHAANDGSWTYSSQGPTARDITPGGFEGWAFALNRSGSLPAPRAAPRRPVAPTTAPTTPRRSTPTTGPTRGTTTPPPATTTGSPRASRPAAHQHGRPGRTHSTRCKAAGCPAARSAPGSRPPPASPSAEGRITGDVPKPPSSGGAGSALGFLSAAAVAVLVIAGGVAAAVRRRAGRS